MASTARRCCVALLLLALSGPGATAQRFDDARPIGGLRALPNLIDPAAPVEPLPDGDREARLRELVRRSPGAAEHHAALGELLLGEGRLHEATASLTEAARLAPGDAAHVARLASALLALEAWRAAADHFERAAALRPESAAYHHGWGLALLGDGRAMQAAVAFREAARLEPSETAHLDQLDRALRTLDPAAPAEPAALSRTLANGAGFARALGAGLVRLAFGLLLGAAAFVMLVPTLALLYLMLLRLPAALLQRAA